MPVIAVTGATGHLGRLVVARLKAKVPTAEIVALVRSTAKASDLGVSARAADYDEPATLDAALAGVDTLLLISANDFTKRAVQHAAVLASAKAAGVTRIVYTSLLHADKSVVSLAEDHRVTEAALRASGLRYTILRNGWYYENHDQTVAGAVAGGTVLGAAADGVFSSASRADYADAAVAVLTGAPDAHDGKVYELAGDAGFTLAELAAEISRQAGKPVAYKGMSEAEFAAALSGMGLPEPVAQLVAGFDAAAAQGALYDDSHQLSTLIGHPTTSLADAVGAALRRGPAA
jgi:NAD(P)H dehydrogenase (quinone)